MMLFEHIFGKVPVREPVQSWAGGYFQPRLMCMSVPHSPPVPFPIIKAGAHLGLVLCGPKTEKQNNKKRQFL